MGDTYEAWMDVKQKFHNIPCRKDSACGWENKTLPIKAFGSDKFICAAYNVTDAKAWAKEKVWLMNEAEKAHLRQASFLV